jgi:hypothetical protein
MSEFNTILNDALKGLGRDTQELSVELRTYAAARVAHLAQAVGQPGYEKAAKAEAEALALKVARAAVSTADAADQRLVGVIQGILLTAARVAATNP